MSKMYQKIFCLHEFSYQNGTDTVIRVEKNGLFKLNIPVCNADIFDDWNVLLVMDCSILEFEQIFLSYQAKIQN